MALFKKTGKTDILRDRVAAFIVENFEDLMSEVEPGLWFGRSDTAGISIRVNGDEDGDGSITIDSPVLCDVRPTNEIFRHLLTEAQYRNFRWEVDVDSDDGTAMLRLGVDLMVFGGEIDDRQIFSTTLVLGRLADEIGPELAARFGGRVFFEED